ncbi:MAG TPA: NADH-quinone oxidoreductase subunit I [Bacteroidota bacterium]|nr:NADH-quinone oxidoreductase subunit I [Bacteroidota bacterium]
MSRYFRGVWDGVYTVLIGMKVTWRHLFTSAVTIQYPDVKVKLPERARNRLYVNMDDCIGCDQCAMACPVDCITIETVKSTPDVDLGLTSVGTKKRLYVSRFDIDIAKCCYCGLCVYPCPTECIKMTDVYEFSEYERENLVYRFAVMTPTEVDAAKSRLVAYDREQAAKKAAAAAAKAAAPAPPHPAAAPAGAPAPAASPSTPAQRPAAAGGPSPAAAGATTPAAPAPATGPAPAAGPAPSAAVPPAAPSTPPAAPPTHDTNP